MYTIKRKEYLDFLIRWQNKQIIKIVSGVRRCGKSTLFEIFQNYLLKNGINNSQIISINFEDIEYEELKKYKILYNYILRKLEKGKRYYIFLDEIQHVDEFEKVVDSLYIKKNCDVYITGSNAYFMSGEFATLLSGRYVEIKMLPLSFKEYYDAYKDNDKKMLSQNELYNLYIKNSSFPYVMKLEDENDIKVYLQGIYDSVLLKDIVARFSISDVSLLKRIIRFIFDNIGNTLSTTKVANTLTTLGRKSDNKTVEKYVRALVESLIVYKAERYNIKGKQHLATLEKYYVVDIGLRYMLLGKRSTDVGHILENVIFLELIRRGYEVYIGKIDDLEVDFVAIDKTGTTYFQVSASVRDKNTLERELKSLKKIKDTYPKIILTLDEDPDADYEGIKRINAINWLLGTN